MGACVGKSGSGAGNDSSKRITAIEKGEVKGDHLFKIVFLGDANTGKSSIILRATDNVFTGQAVSTIGADFKVKVIDVDGVVVKNQLFDTGGTERFRNVTVSYMRGSSGCILVYDCTSRSSFENIKNWSADAAKMTQDTTRPLSFLLLGNKMDMTAERAVSTEEGSALADSLGAEFAEVSAKDNLGIDEALRTFTKTLIAQATGQLT